MANWKAWQHQKDISEEAINIIKAHGLVYLAMEERTGKCLTAIMTCEDTAASRVLVITTVKALDGWNEALCNYPHINAYTLINYHSAHKVQGPFDIVILDESHNIISAYPKRSQIWKNIHKIIYGLPIIYSSATPHAQGPQMLFNQFALCKWSPWSQYKDFYAWFKHYAKRDKAGNFKTIYLGPNRQAIDYTAIDEDKVLKDVRHLFITKTRRELGFEQEPEDVLHYIELSDQVKEVYNTLIADLVLDFSCRGKDYVLVCDSPMKLRTSLHMLEGGGFKLGDSKDDYLVLNNREKIDYILEKWGDTSDLVIMYQYIVEGIKLRGIFKNAKVLQGQSYAEGIDLSMYKDLVIYSQNFQTSKHTQRRARQANMDRKEEIRVHFLLVKRAISEQVYNTVSVNKTNFVDSVFVREEL